MHAEESLGYAFQNMFLSSSSLLSNIYMNMSLTEMKAQNKFAYDRIHNSLVYALEPAKNP